MRTREFGLAVIVLVASMGCLFGQPVQLSYDANGNLQTVAIAGGLISPVIIAQPQNALAEMGGQASFSVVAAGTEPLTYQWFAGGAPITGATADTLYLSNLVANEFTDYTVVVSNGAGAATSAPAALNLDSTDDGIADAWKLAYFGTTTNAAYSMFGGLPLIDYYQDGANPTNVSGEPLTLTVNAFVAVEPLLAAYPPGTAVTLTALPVAGQSFNEWSNGFAGAHPTTTFIITSNTTVAALRGNPGLDPAWTPTFTADDGGVYSSLLQPDGKMVVAGRFSEINGVPIQNVGRLNPDGTVDTNFISNLELGTTDNSYVHGMALQADGKILLAGSFSAVDYLSRNGIARLNTNGAVDPSFNPGYGLNGQAYCVAVLSDGRIVVGGPFSQVNGTNRGNIAILDQNGALDTTFAPTNGGFNGAVNCVSVQSGDRILVSGQFNQYNGQPAPSVVRLLTNAVLDPTFNPGGAGPNYLPQQIRVLNDGNLFCVGQFSQYNSTPGDAVLLDPNGNPLPTFTNTALLNGEVTSFLQDQAGGIILGGYFNYYGSTPCSALARFNGDGTFDTNFASLFGLNRDVWSLVQETSGALIVGGEFSSWSNSYHDRLIALNATNASPLTNFYLQAAFRSEVTQTLLQTNNSLMVGGNFVAADGQSAQRLARLTPAGQLDTNFVLTNPPNGAVDAITLAADGSYYIGGSFNYCGNQYTPGMAHLSPTGVVDTNFQLGAGFDGTVEAIAVQPGAGILVGGNFQDAQGQLRPAMVRLLTNGLLDFNFSPAIGGVNSASGLDGVVYCIALQPDGKILIAGEFGTVLGAPMLRVARLLPDGELDTTFNPGAGLDGTVFAMALETNGEILIGGGFNYADGLYRPHLALLTTNGLPDLSFPADNTGFNNTVWQLALAPDQSIWVVGDYGQVNGVTDYRCAHLFSNGSLDPNFNTGVDLNDNTYTVAAATDGSVYVGGWIRQVYNRARVGMLRFVPAPGMQVQFTGTEPAGANFAPDQSIQLTATASSPAGITGVQFEVSTNSGGDFVPVSSGVLDFDAQWTGSWEPTEPGTYYLRAVAADGNTLLQPSLFYGPVTIGSAETLPGYAAWATANFSASQQTNQAISGEFADPYNDGYPNWVKFAAGIAPNAAPTVTGGLWPATGSPLYPTVTYSENPAATGVQFTVEVSTNLVNWSSGPSVTTLVDVTTNGQGDEVVRERSDTPIESATAQYLRVTVTLP